VSAGPPAVVEVLIARHPQTVANVRGAFVGSGESEFTPLGVTQAAQLAACIAAWGPACVLASPRDRARVVGAEAATLAGVPLHVDEGLAEIDLLGGPPEAAPFKDGETWHAFAARVAVVAGGIATRGPRIAVVTHGGVVRALLTQWMGLPHTAAWRFAVPNASVATLTLSEGVATLRTFGLPAGACAWEMAWEAAGPPVT
jgi:alpha-ribazole phosphatase